MITAVDIERIRGMIEEELQLCSSATSTIVLISKTRRGYFWSPSFAREHVVDHVIERLNNRGEFVFHRGSGPCSLAVSM